MTSVEFYELIQLPEGVIEQLNEYEKQRKVDIPHEIRTPINAVLGMDEMILKECKDSTIKEYATDIQAAGNTLLTIINNILDLNKIESGKMEIIPVEYDVSNMTKIRAKDKNLSFHVSVSPDIPMRMCGDLLEIIREKLPEERIKACIQL